MKENLKSLAWTAGAVIAGLIVYNYLAHPLMTKAGIKPLA